MTFYEWHETCCSWNFCLNDLKKEVIEIKKQLQKRKLDGFVASDGWHGK